MKTKANASIMIGKISFRMLMAACLLIAMGLSACGGSAKPASLSFGNAAQAAATELAAIKTEKGDLPDGLASAIYAFDLNDALDQPVTVTIPITASAPKGAPEAKPMLGVGVTVSFENGTTETFYDYVEASLADDQASATFIPADFANAGIARGRFHGNVTLQGTPWMETVSLGIFWCETTFIDGGHFLVSFPYSNDKPLLDKTNRVALLNDLEAAYNNYLAKNYSYSQRLSWPMKVNIQRSDVEGAYTYGSDGAQGKISINRKFFEDGSYQSDAVKPLLAHEFFHFVQLNYESSSDDNDWFDEATATYFEAIQQGTLPSIFVDNKELIFSGIIPPENTSKDGYARVPLIKYLAKTGSEDFIRSTYELVKEGHTWDFAQESAIRNVKDWAGDFYAALVKGELGEFSPYTLHKEIVGATLPKAGRALALSVPDDAEMQRLRDEGEDAVLGATALPVQPFGAQMVALTIEAEEAAMLQDGDVPVVRVGDGADARVMEVRGNSVTDISKGTDSFPLDGLKQSLDNKVVYLVLVTGLHETGTQEYAVSVVIPNSNAAGRTNGYTTSRSVDIYNGNYNVSESFSITASSPFTLEREVVLGDIIGVSILVYNKNADVSLTLTADVSNPTFTAKMSNLAGYTPHVKEVHWTRGSGNLSTEINGPVATITIPKGQSCAGSYSYSMVIENYNESSGYSTWGGSASLFQVSIGCRAP